MLGGILHCKGVTLGRASLTHPLELGAAVADGQLGAPVRTPRDCRHRSSTSADTPSWIRIHHRCLRFALLPISQVVLCLAEESIVSWGSHLEVIGVDLHRVVLSHPLLHDGGEPDGAVQERLIFLNLLEESVHLSSS